jgi:hypothetical protein
MFKWEYIGKDADVVKTLSGFVIATSFRRIVYGGRGAYVEFTPNQMFMFHLTIPSSQQWRISSRVAYYIEYRTKDESNVKVYFQLRPVVYADYIPGMLYIAPRYLQDFRSTSKIFQLSEV